MLKHVFWKGFWRNKKNFFLVSACGVFLISTLFSCMAFSDFLTQIVTGEESDMVADYVATVALLLTAVLLQLLLVLSVICYMRTRAGEYGMLDVMGLKRKHKFMFVGVEYLTLLVISIGGGILFGVGESWLLRHLVVWLYPESKGKLVIGRVPYRFAVIYGIIVFVLMFIICDELISCLGASEVLNLGVKSGKKPKQHPLMWKVGAGFLLAALLIMQSYWGRVSKLLHVVLGMAGMYLLYVSVGGVLLLGIKKKESKYYKMLVWLNTWYYRFYHNLNMMFIVSAFLFAAVYLFALPVMDQFPINTDEKYPYDLVWMASLEDMNFVEELTKEYGVEARTQECIRVTTPDFGEHMGISESAYEGWSGGGAGLEGKEIMIIYQRERKDWNSLELDYESKKPRLAIGSAKDDLWINTPAGTIPSRKFDTRYERKESRDETLTGVFASSTSEDIIVFSDEYYESVKNEAEGPNLAVMLKIPEQYDKVTEQIFAYASEHPSGYSSLMGDVVIYEKKELMASDRYNRILSLLITGVNFVLILICSVFVTLIKIGNDQQEMEQKYSFYFQMGMPFSARKKGIMRECRMTVWIPVLAGIGTGIIFVIRELFLRILPGVWTLRYLAGIFTMCMGTVFVYGVVSKAINSDMVKKAGRKWDDERRE